MTALKKTVGTSRGVEPAGRPARREVERGRRARTNSSRTFAQRAGPAARYLAPGRGARNLKPSWRRRPQSPSPSLERVDRFIIRRVFPQQSLAAARRTSREPACNEPLEPARER